MTSTTTSTVYVAIGSNLASAAGGPEATVRAAIDALGELSQAAVVSSGLYVTDALDCEPGAPQFVNAAACLDCPLDSPFSLLKALQEIEARFGRKRDASTSESAYQSRSLDLDLIAFSDQTVQHPDLILPHPRALERVFVLQPLADIAPDLRLPGSAMTVKQALDELVSPP